MPSVAVVVATYNRGAELVDTLRDVQQQLPASGEVWVVDQSEATVRRDNHDFVAWLNDDRFHWIEQEPSLPRARNTGIARSSADIVWFIDDDVRLSEGCLDGHLRAYKDPRVGGVVGAITERTLRPNAPVTTNRVATNGRVLTNLEGSVAQDIETLKGCNMSFRRRALEQVELFDPGFGGTAFLEDADVSTRVLHQGWVLRFEPTAHLTHLATDRGGVRMGDAIATECWRFQNTGRFVRKHRNRITWPLVMTTFAGIALKRAVQWKDPSAPASLMRALLRGMKSGRDVA